MMRASRWKIIVEGNWTHYHWVTRIPCWPPELFHAPLMLVSFQDDPTTPRPSRASRRRAAPRLPQIRQPCDRLKGGLELFPSESSQNLHPDFLSNALVLWKNCHFFCNGVGLGDGVHTFRIMPNQPYPYSIRIVNHLYFSVDLHIYYIAVHKPAPALPLKQVALYCC